MAGFYWPNNYFIRKFKETDQWGWYKRGNFKPVYFWKGHIGNPLLWF